MKLWIGGGRLYAHFKLHTEVHLFNQLLQVPAIQTTFIRMHKNCCPGFSNFLLRRIMELLLTPQEPGTSNNIVKDAEAGLKSRTPTVHSDRGLFTHQWYYVHIYSDREKGVQGSRGRSGAVQSNTMTTLTHTLSGQVQGGVNKEMEKGVNRAQRTMGKYTSESAGVTNTGK